jgi:hypothetical protein
VAAIRPYIIRVSIIYPYKGTKFHDFCTASGMLDEQSLERTAAGIITRC